MLAALLLAQAAPPAAPAPPVPAPPAKWDALPELAVQRNWSSDPRLSHYVRQEVVAGRCTAVTPTDTGAALEVELAMFVAPDGQVRRIVPRAIGCATVEQYATGLASQMLRRNTIVPEASGWHRTTIRFAWQG